MSGTIHASGGLRRITRRQPPGSWRLAGFGAAVVAGALVIVWTNRSIDHQMNRLQRELAAVESERYYVGVHMRVSTRKLNSTLLEYHLTHQPPDRAAFDSEAAALRRWLMMSEASLNTANERNAYRQLCEAYARYLAATKPIMAISTNLPMSAFPDIYRQVWAESRPLLDLCEELVKAQRQAFDRFIDRSEGTLARLQGLLLLSMLLVLTLAGSLAVLVYRGMIAPLREHLSQSQAVIERQEKLASLGVLAAGVAHEIRNPLTAIKFRLFSLNKALHGELERNEDATVISDEINRLDRIVKEFLQFARPSPPELLRVPADRLLQEVSDLLGAQLGKTAIGLKVEAPESVWVSADAHQLKQVLINLVQNSAQSIERDGTVTLRLRRDTEPLNGAAGPVAILSVADTGRGIPAEVEKRLFDPFFTTKEGGTGLGLAIAARIVEKHGGQLRYATEVNRGTTFEIVLPRHENHATEHPPH